MVIVVLGYCPSRGDSQIVNGLGKVCATYLFCVDKTSSAELSKAINSMFCWYQHSSKCYALLIDVSIQMEDNDLDHRDLQLQMSRWFTRGWTLRELLASPSNFSWEGKSLGSKKLLEKQLSKITGIPVAALQGIPLSFFSTQEKLS